MRLPFRDPLGADNLGEIRKCWILMFVALEFFFFNLSLVSGIIKKKKKKTLIFWLTQRKINQKQAPWLPGHPATGHKRLTVQQQPKEEAEVRKRLGVG